MNKADLIDAVAERMGSSRKDAAAAVEATFECLAESVRKGEPVRIAGFGTFDRKQRSARVGRHPQTGEQMSIAPSETVGFRPSRVLRAQLNGAPGTRGGRAD